MDFALVLRKDFGFQFFLFSFQLLKDVVEKTLLRGHRAEERRAEEMKGVTLERAVLHARFNSYEY